MSWKAAEAICQELCPQSLVFPNLAQQEFFRLRDGGRTDGGGTASFPNGFLAIVPRESRVPIDKALHAYEREWKRISTRSREVVLRATDFDNRDAVKRLWRQQTKTPFEVFWTVTEWPDNVGYGEAFARASTALEARKVTHNFDPIKEQGWKCSLDGVREALPGIRLGSAFEERTIQREYWGKLAKAKEIKIGASKYRIANRFRPTEPLSAPSIVRRLATRLLFEDLFGRKLPFPSTASVAALPFIKHVVYRIGNAGDLLRKFLKANEEVRESLGAELLSVSPYPNALFASAPGDLHEIARLDGTWWYQSTYDAASLRNEFQGSATESELQACRKCLRDLTTLVEAEPSTYFGVLRADADSVGEWITGNKLPFWRDSCAKAGSSKDLSISRTLRPPGVFSHIAISEALGTLFSCKPPDQLRPALSRSSQSWSYQKGTVLEGSKVV